MLMLKKLYSMKKKLKYSCLRSKKDEFKVYNIIYPYEVFIWYIDIPDFGSSKYILNN